MLSRRRFLTSTVALAGLAGAPRLVWGAAGADGFTVLRAKGGVAPLLGDKGDPTAIWGYDGQCPGPTLRVRQGETLQVRLVNQLLEPTSIHWHGIRLPNAMDGTALTQEPVAPGDSFDYEFASPDAGTFWYHAHVGTAEQVARGLYGVLIVEEESPPEPLTDVIMVIDDWWLFDSGAINDDTFGDLMVASHGGRMGNWMTVNGTSRPVLAAPAGERLRLRLVNVANARVMQLSFKGADPHLLAIDGQPLAAPRALAAEPVVLPPGGRADVGLPAGRDQVIVTVEIEGEPLELAFIDRTVAPEPFPQPDSKPDTEGEDEPEARIKARVVSVAEALREAEPEPDTGDFAALPANPLPAALDLAGAVAASLVMEGGASGGMEGAMVDGEHLTMRELVGHGMTWAMNGNAGMGEDPLVSVERGRTVALRVENRTTWSHALHLHGHYVRVVEADGAETDDPVWRDSVLIDPRATLTIAFVADNPGKWLVQCRILEHAEAGMMSWLEVT